MGASNKSMRMSYGIYCKSNGNVKNSIPHPFEPKHNLYFMADVPHLLKKIKQSLFNNKFITIPDDVILNNNLTSNIVDYKHIEQLANHQDDLELKLDHQINVNGFKKLNHFDKMKVSKSKNILSTDVSASLQYLVKNEGYHSSYNTTAWFVKQVAKWFTLMASRNPTVVLSKFNSKKYLEKLQFLRDFMDMFKIIKIGVKGTWKPCQNGVLLSIQSVLDLQDLFLNKKKL